MNVRMIVGRLLIVVGHALIFSAIVAALLGVSHANATIINGLNGGRIEYVSGGAIISDGSGVSFQGRTWDVPSSRTVRATDTGAPLRLGGKDINVNAARTMTPLAIGKASAAALKALPVVGTGIAIWDIWDAVRVRPDGEGGIVNDPGVSPVTGTQWRWKDGASGGVYPYTSITEGLSGSDTSGGKTTVRTVGTPSCGAVSNAWVDGQFIPVQNCSVPQNWTCTNVATGTSCGSGTLTKNRTGAQFSTSECPASIDASNPEYSLPAGLPVGADGKCRTARYNHQPITPQAAAEKLEADDPPTGEQLREMAEDAVARGEGIEASERIVSGPSSAPGTPTVTTAPKPGGGTTTTTKTSTTHYTYNNNTVNYTIVTVTTVNDGTTETTTTEGTVPEESDQCKTSPDSLGCSKMGTPGSDAPSWQTRDVIFAPEDLGFTGSCPAPETWDVFGMSLTWGYEPICDIAPFIRFALLAFAGIGAISIVIRETNT